MDDSHRSSEHGDCIRWNYKEGYSREGRREIPKSSFKIRHSKTAGEEKKSKSSNGKNERKNKDENIIEKYGDEFDVCETAKEAIERMIKSDPRLAEAYQKQVEKLNDRLNPHGTTYQTSFMQSFKAHPTDSEYEEAVKEFRSHRTH